MSWIKQIKDFKGVELEGEVIWDNSGARRPGGLSFGLKSRHDKQYHREVEKKRRG